MTTKPNSFKKQPYEEFNIEVEFDKALKTNDITAVTVVAINDDTEEDKTSDLIEGSEISSDKKSIIVGVKGGVDGITYKITVQVTSDELLTDSSSEYCKYEADVLMVISEE